MIVEDGAGRADADSYCSLADANEYLAARGRNATWATLTTGQKEGRLIMATAYLDAHCRWAGELMRSEQALGWPRADAMDKHGRVLSSAAVPAAVRNAAIEIAQAGEITTERTRAAISKTVGPISVEYADGYDVSQGPGRYAFALALVSDLVLGSVTNSIRLVRA